MVDKRLRKISFFAAMLAAALTSACGEPAPLKVVPLVVEGAGAYQLDGQPIALPELKHALRDLRNSKANIELHIHTQADVAYEEIARVLVAAQYAGIAKVSFVTTPPH